MLPTRTIMAAGAGAIALTLLGPQAFAQATFTNTNIQTYATEAVSSSTGNSLTIQAGPTFTSAATTAVSTAGSFLITFTMPDGVDFVNQPSAAVSDPIFAGAGTPLCNANNTLAPTGQTKPGQVAPGATVTFTIGINAGAAIGEECRVQLNAMQITGAAQLTSKTTSPNDNSGTGFVVKEQVSGSSGVTPSFNQAAAVAVGLASSDTQLGFLTTVGKMGGETLAIDIGPAGLGQKFQPNGTGTAPCGGTNGSDQVCGDIGAVEAIANGFLNATATDVFRFSNNSVVVTINGNFSGIAKVFLAGASNAAGTAKACLATATAEAGQANAIAGTIDPSNAFVTFSGVGPNATTNPFDNTPGGVGYNGTKIFQEVCLYAAGGTLIGANPNGFTSTASIDTGLATASSTADAAKKLLPYTYNGSVQKLLYVPKLAALGGSYPTYLRIANNSGADATVIALIQSENGNTTSTQVVGPGPNGTVPAKNNILVAISDLISNSGLTLDSTGRASLQILSPVGVDETMFIVNPDGTVTQGGSGCAGSVLNASGGPC